MSAGDRFSVATTFDNEVFSWGYRNHGRLGDGILGDTGNRYHHYQVMIYLQTSTSLHSYNKPVQNNTGLIIKTCNYYNIIPRVLLCTTGGFPLNADATVNFACKRPIFADTWEKGGVKKRSNFADVFYGWPFSLLKP